jgi:hypothetical protein
MRRKDFLTGSGLPEDNRTMSYVLVLLMAIVLSVSIIFWDASTSPFISKEGEVTRKITGSVTT